MSSSALIQHFESGTCPSRLTRAMVDRYVAEVDRGGVITDPARLIRGPDGSVEAPTTRYWASEQSWNGSAYECYVCHHEFNALAHLNQHLSSGTHDSSTYRCPTAYGGCGTQFTRLSGLCQHVESGQCGVSRFRRSIDNMIDRGLRTGMRAITG